MRRPVGFPQACPDFNTRSYPRADKRRVRLYCTVAISLFAGGFLAMHMITRLVLAGAVAGSPADIGSVGVCCVAGEIKYSTSGVVSPSPRFIF